MAIKMESYVVNLICVNFHKFRKFRETGEFLRILNTEVMNSYCMMCVSLSSCRCTLVSFRLSVYLFVCVSLSLLSL